MTTKELVKVQAGQIWKDNDKRGYGRLVYVEEIGQTHALCRSGSPVGRTVRIRLNRFRPNSTGYRYVGPWQAP